MGCSQRSGPQLRHRYLRENIVDDLRRRDARDARVGVTTIRWDNAGGAIAFHVVRRRVAPDP